MLHTPASFDSTFLHTFYQDYFGLIFWLRLGHRHFHHRFGLGAGVGWVGSGFLCYISLHRSWCLISFCFTFFSKNFDLVQQHTLMTRTHWAAEDFPVLAAFHEMPSLPDGGFREREFSFVGGDLILHVFP